MERATQDGYIKHRSIHENNLASTFMIIRIKHNPTILALELGTGKDLHKIVTWHTNQYTKTIMHQPSRSYASSITQKSWRWSYQHGCKWVQIVRLRAYTNKKSEKNDCFKASGGFMDSTTQCLTQWVVFIYSDYVKGTSCSNWWINLTWSEKESKIDESRRQYIEEEGYTVAKRWEHGKWKL